MKILRSAAVAVLFLLHIQIATAETALDFTGLDGGQELANGSYSQGWRFTANSAIQVTSLGYYVPSSGMAEAHEVGIFQQDTCNLVASGTVLPTDPLSGSFRFHDISPVTLEAGREYYIAGVTHSDKYAVNVGTLIIDPAITFWGYAQYGFVTPTTTLLCPNGLGSQNYPGDFGPTFRFGSSSGGDKRPTAISLFCNRSGSNFTTVTCSATVGDTGAPPRTTPPGDVSFVATNGFSPSSASCTLQQVSFSPGVGSCQAQFQAPEGFPIGVAFPINATYPGDTGFTPASTVHGLIYASCVSTPEKPCKNSVGLSFLDDPAVINGIMALEAECGGGTTKTAGALPRKQTNGTLCNIDGANRVELLSALDGITPDEFRAMAAATTTAMAKEYPVLQFIRDAATTYTDDQLSNLLRTKAVTTEPNAKLAKFLKNGPPSDPNKRSFYLRAKKRKPIVSIIPVGSFSSKLKAQSAKIINAKFNPIGQKLIAAFKAAGLSQFPLTMLIKTQRTGDKKPKQKTAKVKVTIG